jgi:glycerol uptake facilitator-like aquaporin
MNTRMRKHTHAHAQRAFFFLSAGWVRCLLEIFMQILGGVLGAAMSKYLTAGNVILSNPGCFGPNFGIGGGQIFFWELTTTFVLVSVVFATAVDDAAAGHFVSVAPLAIGMSLFACAQASGPFTGGCLNPARFLGPAIVFGCGWPWFAPYVFGQFIGGALAGIIFRLRLKLQQLYKEHVEEMAARQQAEGGEGDDVPLNSIAPTA